MNVDTSKAGPTCHPCRLLILPLLMFFCTLIYYFGELVDLIGAEGLRWSFFYSVHDIHRLLFLAPIIYAGYTARTKGSIIITLVSAMIILPRALFISPYPDPLLRAFIFIIAAGAIGAFVGTLRNKLDQRSTGQTAPPQED